LKIGAAEREKTTRPVVATALRHASRQGASWPTPSRPEFDTQHLPAASAIAEGDDQLPAGGGDTVEGRWREVPAAGAIGGWVDEVELQLLESGGEE
jgi:hypothetical protein